MDACREMAQLREGLQAIVERKKPLLVSAQPEPYAFFLHLLHKRPGYAVVVVEIGGQAEVALVPSLLLHVCRHHLPEDVSKMTSILRPHRHELHLRTNITICLYSLS